MFRAPSNNSNGNTFDFGGRQVSCEHLLRRVVRYENDGTVTVLADAFDGKPLNSPNDVVPHPDGSYWFTDPPFGGQLYEGVPDAPGGPSNAQGLLRQRVGQAAGVGDAQRELPTNVYRVAPNGRVTIAIGADQLPGPPNGLAFSPDHKRLYVVSGGNVHAGDVADDGRVGGVKQFADFTIDGVACRTDGIRADVYGNLWCSSNAGRSVGYSGVTVWNPAGTLLGRIRLPEACAQRRVRRAEAQPAVHGREPVAVRGVREHAGRRTRLTRVAAAQPLCHRIFAAARVDCRATAGRRLRWYCVYSEPKPSRNRNTSRGIHARALRLPVQRAASLAAAISAALGAEHPRRKRNNSTRSSSRPSAAS